MAILKTEVNKIDTDKLKTVPDDLAKLSNVVKNDFVKKTDYNAKINAIGSTAQATLRNMLDNLTDISKLKKSTPNTNNFVLKTKFEKDVKDLDDKIPDVSGLATKTSLAAYLQTATFNSKVTEAEKKYNCCQ